MSVTPHAQAPGKERIVLLMLAAVQFTHVLDFMIMMPLGERLMRVLDITPAVFSHLVAAYGLSAAVFGFAAGFFIDRFDRKRALLVLYAGFTLATLACALAPSHHALLIARVAAGACGGVASSVVTAMVADVIPPERRGRAMGVVAAAFPVASVLGVPLGLLLAERYEWNAAFFLLAGCSALVWAAGAGVLPAMHSAHPPTHPWRQMKAILQHPVHRRGFLLGGMLIVAGGTIIPFLAPSMQRNVGLTESQLPLIYLAGGIATFVTTPIFGRLSDRYEKLHVLGWTSLAGAVVVLVLVHLPPSPVWVAMIITSLFMVTMSGRFSPAMAMISNAVEARYRGGFMSVNAAIQQASGALANIVAGMLVYEGADGRLSGYPNAGFVSIACFAIAVWFAARLRALAPHASRPGHIRPMPQPVPDGVTDAPRD